MKVIVCVAIAKPIKGSVRHSFVSATNTDTHVGLNLVMMSCRSNAFFAHVSYSRQVHSNESPVQEQDVNGGLEVFHVMKLALVFWPPLTPPAQLCM